MKNYIYKKFIRNLLFQYKTFIINIVIKNNNY